jgi:uncharacterized protein YyaL (SSP411 family)
MANRLVDSTSPYLVQHADNPVDWWEWGPEALAVAKELDRPILLSVGYAACHWCHVMAHESFEDAATATFMNDHFVNIKVDREERPDIDAVYMRATQAMTGQGGWPMTCILTPDGEPFFAGTYFPPEPRQGMPAFTQVLQALADAWENRRDDVSAVSADVVQHLRQESDHGGDALGADDDDEAGGFGASPKFPPSMVLEFLLRQHARSDDPRSLEMVRTTCDAMARGGIYDQLSGGFARYGVDRFWRVPHFEKMLYDNALLLRIYLHLWRATGSPLAERVARETARFIIDELGTDEGGFASALDADSDGHEGTFYVWNPNQLMRVLGAGDAAWAATLLGVTGTGTFERGFSTLQLLEDPDDADRWSDVRARLLEARAKRTRPARDDKVVAAWNGLAITALAEASVLLDDPTLADAAVTVASPRHSSRCSASPAIRSGSTAPRCSSTTCSNASPHRTADSSTPRTTPKRSWSGRRTPPTTRLRLARRPSWLPSWPSRRSAGSTATARQLRPGSRRPRRLPDRHRASPAGVSRRRRPCSPVPPRSPSSAHDLRGTTCIAPPSDSRRRARSSSQATWAPTSPCSRARPRSTGSRPSTSAATSSARCP